MKTRADGDVVATTPAPGIVGPVKDLPNSAGEARVVHPFMLVRTDGTVASFDPTRLVHLAGWLRHAAHMASRRLEHDASFTERFVCGHADGDNAGTRRLSYVPVPSVGHAHVDGRVRRALVIEPFGDREPRAATVISALSGAELQDKNGRIRAFMRPAMSQGDATAGLDRYLSPATMWASVTPMLLPGRDDHRSRKAVDLVVKALGQAGYSTPVMDVRVQRDPIFAGSQVAESYTVAAHLRQWPRVHAVVSFAEPVPGPVLIGTGRHFGLGLFAAM